MKSRSSHVRSKIVALLVSLVALWAFAAYVTLRDGLNLLWVNTLDRSVGRPTDAVITALQEERRVSMVYLGSGRMDQKAALDTSRTDTDAAATALERLSTSTRVRWAASPAAESRIADTLAALRTLSAARAGVDTAAIDRAGTATAFNNMIDTAFLVYDSLTQFADEQIAAEGRAIVALTRCREILAREDALLSGVFARGRFGPGEPTEFSKIVGAERMFYADGVARLPSDDRARYSELSASAPFVRFHGYEDQILGQAREGAPAPVSATAWRSTTQSVLSSLRSLELSFADTTVARATPAAAWTIVQLVLAGGLGLIAVIASIVVSISTARALVRQLELLRNSARELALFRLPRVVERLRHGEQVDVAYEAPPLNFGRDVIGQVGQAFNEVQQTAVQVAVDQAELRRSVRDVFLSLARRSQALLHRQLGLLDSMERRSTDPEELGELFRIDHLATRMRRNAENLIVLSGATAGRAWRKPIAMIDVLRGALAEVEDYTRVAILPVGSASIVGRAVGDVIHLLAELIENAVSFSPPQTAVRVSGSVVGNGFAIEIEDRGLGMPEAERSEVNEALRHPPELRLTSTARLGLYVVGQLAQRHGIRVRLAESPYGGTTAIVLLPADLIADAADEPLVEESLIEEPLIQEGGQPIGAGHEPALATIGTAAGAATTAELPPAAAAEAAAATAPTVSAAPAAPSAAADSAPPATLARSSPVPATAQAAEPPIFTAAGLPWRRRDTPNGAHPSPPPPEPDTAPAGQARTPEHVRDRMASYRSGTLRGRTDAAELAAPDNHHIPQQLPSPDEER